MIKNYLSYFKIIVLMLCSVVGVGFVSGAEIYQFFVRFGKFSYLGVLMFFILTFCLVSKILKKNNDVQNAFKMNNLTQNTANNTFLIKSKVKSKLLFLNILMIASAMFAGLFNIINKLFFNNYFIFCILAIVIIFMILFFGISGLQKFDYFVFGLILFIFVYFLFNIKIVAVAGVKEYLSILDFKNLASSIIFAVIYVFMNIIQIQPILNEKKIQFSNSSRKIFSFAFSLSLTILLFVFVKFLNSNLYLKTSEMPFFKFFKLKGGVCYVVFIIGLLTALFSSLITALLGVKNRLKERFGSNVFSCIFAIVLSLVVSLIGFKNFVSVVYPMVGIINFIIYVFL